jgi:hypothetical protein
LIVLHYVGFYVWICSSLFLWFYLIDPLMSFLMFDWYSLCQFFYLITSLWWFFLSDCFSLMISSVCFSLIWLLSDCFVMSDGSLCWLSSVWLLLSADFLCLMASLSIDFYLVLSNGFSLLMLLLWFFCLIGLLPICSYVSLFLCWFFYLVWNC